MCGILGAIPALSDGKFSKGLDKIAHRGPDGVGMWSDGNTIQLGHRRLSILDLSEGGSQPMHFEDLTLVFNGEIFNYLEIRVELIGKGYFFISESDSEVLLKAFHCWGLECLHKFNGMWAFAIYNRKSKELILSRDRFGVKPLYYFLDADRLIFASELKALHAILGPSHPLNNRVLATIAAGGFDWHGKTDTWLKDVFILKAGSVLQGRSGFWKEASWYKLREVNTPNDLREQSDYFRVLLADACKLRLRSDVPIGTCLSGGLDSGSITSLINSEGGSYTHRSFCASFPNTPIDESNKAQLLSRRLNSSLDIVSIECPAITELEMAMGQCDGPMHALAFFPIWKLYQRIRDSGIKVTLDGQGPDEMMGGYKPLAPALRYAFRKASPRYLWDVYNVYKEQGETNQASAKSIAKHLLVETIKSELKRPISLLIGRRKKSQYAHPFRTNEMDEELYSEFFNSPLPGILQQYDRCSMAHGVECRMPFMDYRLVEYVYSLPVESKVGGGYTKRVLREAMQGIVPDEIRLDKRKIGFNAPIVDWYTGPLKEWMHDWMSSQVFQSADFFNGKELKREFEKYSLSERPQWDAAWKFWGGVHYAWWKSNLLA
jgi:asparagine synthase (glutamine-hydrolysing)